MRKLLVVFSTALSLVALPAHADRDHYRGGYPGNHRGWHHDRYSDHHRDNSPWVGLAVVGAIAGLAMMAEQSQPRYAAPAYIAPAYPSGTAYSAPRAGTWYYCQSSGSYYPYARACPEGWQAEPARPY